MDESKLKALDGVMAQIEKQYGKGAVMRLGQTAGDTNIEVLPTGCLSLDLAIGVGGLPLVTPASLYYLKSYALLFVLGFLGATPLVKTLANRISGTRICAVLEPLVLLLLLLVCTGYLVDGSFSPFLYFRF